MKRTLLLAALSMWSCLATRDASLGTTRVQAGADAGVVDATADDDELPDAITDAASVVESPRLDAGGRALDAGAVRDAATDATMRDGSTHHEDEEHH